jgi:hypothetical protein
MLAIVRLCRAAINKLDEVLAQADLVELRHRPVTPKTVQSISAALATLAQLHADSLRASADHAAVFQFEIAAGWRSALRLVDAGDRELRDTALNAASDTVLRSNARLWSIYRRLGAPVGAGAGVSAATPTERNAEDSDANEPPLSPEQLRATVAVLLLHALQSGPDERAGAVASLFSAERAEQELRESLATAVAAAGVLGCGHTEPATSWAQQSRAWLQAERTIASNLKAFANEQRKLADLLKRMESDMNKVSEHREFAQAAQVLRRRAEQILAWQRVHVHVATTGLVDAVGPVLDGTLCLRPVELRTGFGRLAERFEALRLAFPQAPPVRPLLDEATALPIALARLVRAERPAALNLGERRRWLGQLVATLQSGRRQLAEEATRQAAGWNFDRASLFDGIARRRTVELLGDGFVRSVAEQAIEGHRAAVESFAQRANGISEQLQRALHPAGPNVGARGGSDGTSAEGSTGAEVAVSILDVANAFGLAGSSSMEEMSQLATVAAHLTREAAELANAQGDLLPLLERHTSAFAQFASVCEGSASARTAAQSADTCARGCRRRNDARGSRDEAPVFSREPRGVYTHHVRHLVDCAQRRRRTPPSEPLQRAPTLSRH